MPRPRRLTPSYLVHKQTGRGRLVWADHTGTRHERLLPGAFGSPESLRAKAALDLEIATSPIRAPDAHRTGISVNELLLAFLDHGERHYRGPDGNPTGELSEYKLVSRHIRQLYGDTPVADFGPLKLKAVRQRMVDAGACRGVVNQRIGRLRRMFKWGVGEELVPPAVYHALAAVTGLQRGRTDARESEPVKPVADEVVSATLAHLTPHVRAIVELMMCTGMRPAEVCEMTLNRIERGAAWTYRPNRHKTAHHGKGRSVPLGPNARAVLSAFLAGRVLAPDEPIFSPRRAREERYARMRAERASKVPPSQRNRRAEKPKWQPAERYTTLTVAHAVAKAAKKAGVEHWHPYQLRHTFATRVRKNHGLEAAQVLLGHSRADVTQVYAERNEELAATVAAKIG
jgi:integrase